MTDSQFEKYTIELLKGIYDNIGNKPYDVISGFFQILYDESTNEWSVDLTSVVNETDYSLEIQSVVEGRIVMQLPDVFNNNSPYYSKYPKVQVFNSLSMNITSIVSCQFYKLNKTLVLDFKSVDAANLLLNDSLGLGFNNNLPFSFEIRLYKE